TVVATGTVSYTFFTNGVCSGSGSSAGTVTLTSTGSVPNSNSEGPLAAGSYSFQATYSGDSNYLGSTSPCEPFGVGRLSITTTVHAGGIDGTSAYDTATVTTSGSIAPTGTVTYVFHTTGDCSGRGFASTVTLTSSGSVPNSATYSGLQARSYSFNATYNGDSN